MECLRPRKGELRNCSDAELQAGRVVGAEESSLFTRRDLWAPLFPLSPPSSDIGRLTCTGFQLTHPMGWGQKHINPIGEGGKGDVLLESPRRLIIYIEQSTKHMPYFHTWLFT